MGKYMKYRFEQVSGRIAQSSMLSLSVCLLTLGILFLPEQVAGEQLKRGQQPQEQRVIRGKVTDAQGAPIVGANVWVKGTTLGVATDVNGDYSLKIGPEAKSLNASFIGYSEAEKGIMPGVDVYNFSLVPEARKLDEVVVVGYGTTRLRDLTGAVSSIGANQLEKEPVMNVASALQGKAAGVQVSLASAKPGEPVKIRVRGSTSLEGTNEPLYVIDGIPSEQADMIAINPDDIQSIDILKDASAAAIYGSRAANGVVLITTKRGVQTEKPQLDLKYFTNFDTQIENFSILNADQFREVIMNAAVNTLKVDPTNKTALSITEGTILRDASTDWYKLLSQKAYTNNVELSVRGGSAKLRYFTSFGMSFQNGVLKGDDLKRYTGRINLDWDITSVLKFGTNISLAYTDQAAEGQGLWQIKQFRPDIPVYAEDGSFYKIGTTDNPVAKTQITNTNDAYRFNGTVFGEARIIPGLRVRSTFSLAKSFNFSHRYYPSFLQEGNNYNTYSGRAVRGSSETVRTLWDNTLAYEGIFREIHALDALFGVSFERYKDGDFSATGVDFPMDHILTNLGSATTPYDVGGDDSSNGLVSVFGRFNYKLMEKYLFTFTARFDGSSKFGSHNRFGFFPSGAIAWKIDQESFMKDITEINELKLRISAGVTGTQNIGNYNNKNLYGPNDFLGKPGIVPTTLGNDDLRWERTKQFDIAVDYAFLDYRLSGTIGWYYKNTNDLLWNIEFPPSLQPFSSMYKNVGRVQNKGFEWVVDARIFRETEVKWNLSFNLSVNRNKVKYLVSEGAQDWAGSGVVQGNGTEVLAEGYPVGSVLGYQTDGIFQSWEQIEEYNKRAQQLSHGSASYYYGSETKPGQIIYRDVNGDGYISVKDRAIIANPEPKFQGGFSSDVSWKDLSLYLMFTYSAGAERLYNNTLQNIAGSLNNLIDYNLNNRWSEENTSSRLPALYVDDPVPATNDLMVHKASYLKLAHLRIQYSLPVLWDAKYYKGGQVYFAIANLFTITRYPGIDPASVGSATANYGGNYDSDIYPGVRSYTLGLRLNF